MKFYKSKARCSIVPFCGPFHSCLWRQLTYGVERCSIDSAEKWTWCYQCGDGWYTGVVWREWVTEPNCGTAVLVGWREAQSYVTTTIECSGRKYDIQAQIERSVWVFGKLRYIQELMKLICHDLKKHEKKKNRKRCTKGRQMVTFLVVRSFRNLCDRWEKNSVFYHWDFSWDTLRSLRLGKMLKVLYRHLGRT